METTSNESERADPPASPLQVVEQSMQSHGAMQVSHPDPAEFGNPNQEKIDRSKSACSYLNVGVYEMQSSREEVDEVAKTSWQPRWSRIGPLLGLLALVLSALSVLVTFAILKASDGKPVESWTYSPSVYLAVITSVTGKALGLAALQGAVITWWLRAIQGCSMKQLHQNWQMGQNIWDALLAGRNINMIAIACICAAIAAIDAPLLQRASSVISTTPYSPIKLNMSLISELPSYYSGSADYPIHNLSRATIGFGISSDMLQLPKKWLKKQPIGSIAKGCPGLCSTTVKAPMIEVWNCTKRSEFVDWEAALPGNMSVTDILNNQEILVNRTIFRTLATLDPSGWPHVEREFMALTIQMNDAPTEPDCKGTLITRDCLLASAIGEYDLIVQDNETRFVNDQPKPRFVAWANNTDMTDPEKMKYRECGCTIRDSNQSMSTLAGLANTANFKYSKKVSLVPDSSTIVKWLNFDDWSVAQTKDISIENYSKTCLHEWVDPFEDILSDINDLMFRTAVHVSRQDFRPNITNPADPRYFYPTDPGIADAIEYVTDGQYISRINVFSVDYAFFWSASTVELLCIAIIMYTFQGWWRLGRAVSFSPLEVAKAFQSPMFAQTNSNFDADMISKELGQRKVKYGMVSIEADRLAFTDTDYVRTPLPGTVISR